MFVGRPPKLRRARPGKLHHDTSNLNSRQPTTTDNMGRLHSKGKGISASALPYSRTAPSWLKTTPEQVVEQICKLARKGATPSQIGVILRDSHGVSQVKLVTGTLIRRISDGRERISAFGIGTRMLTLRLSGNRILRILKSSGTNP